MNAEAIHYKLFMRSKRHQYRDIEVKPYQNPEYESLEWQLDPTINHCYQTYNNERIMATVYLRVETFLNQTTREIQFEIHFIEIYDTEHILAKIIFKSHKSLQYTHETSTETPIKNTEFINCKPLPPPPPDDGYICPPNTTDNPADKLNTSYDEHVVKGMKDLIHNNVGDGWDLLCCFNKYLIEANQTFNKIKKEWAINETDNSLQQNKTKCCAISQFFLGIKNNLDPQLMKCLPKVPRLKKDLFDVLEKYSTKTYINICNLFTGKDFFPLKDCVQMRQEVEESKGMMDNNELCKDMVGMNFKVTAAFKMSIKFDDFICVIGQLHENGQNEESKKVAIRLRFNYYRGFTLDPREEFLYVRVWKEIDVINRIKPINYAFSLPGDTPFEGHEVVFIVQVCISLPFWNE